MEIREAAKKISCTKLVGVAWCFQHDVASIQQIYTFLIHWTLVKCENLIDSRGNLFGFRGRDLMPEVREQRYPKNERRAVGSPECWIGWLRPKFLVRQVWCSYGSYGIVWLEMKQRHFSIFSSYFSQTQILWNFWPMLLWLLWLVIVISTVSTVSTCRWNTSSARCGRGIQQCPWIWRYPGRSKGCYKLQASRSETSRLAPSSMPLMWWCAQWNAPCAQGQKKDRHSHVLCAAMQFLLLQFGTAAEKNWCQ